MALQTYWIPAPLTITNGTGYLRSPKEGIPPNWGVRSYPAILDYIEGDDMGLVTSEIDYYVFKGTVMPAAPAIAKGPGVSEVHAFCSAFNATATFILIIDFFF